MVALGKNYFDLFGIETRLHEARFLDPTFDLHSVYYQKCISNLTRFVADNPRFKDHTDRCVGIFILIRRSLLRVPQWLPDKPFGTHRLPQKLKQHHSSDQRVPRISGCHNLVCPSHHIH